MTESNRTQTVEPGILYVVATPIGNLEDMTFRAVRVLQQVSLIAAEDTRHSRKLLLHYQIDTPLISCHEHNEMARIADFMEKLKHGQSIALVSDAGTPSISDPGYRLVKACTENGIQVVPVPGPSAVTAGMSVSGLPTDRFHFSGFLSRKTGRRKKEIEALQHYGGTLVFYESPRRIVRLLEEMAEILGKRPAMLAREITKRHEEYLRGDLGSICDQLANRDQIKGECALFVGGFEEAEPVQEDDLDSEIRLALALPGTRTSSLAKQLSERFRLSKTDVYNRILSLQKQDA